MTRLFKLPIDDRGLCTIEIVQKADRSISARLLHVRTRDIDEMEEPRDALKRIANLLREAADGMEAEAEQIGHSLESA